MPAPSWKTPRCVPQLLKQAQQGVLPAVLVQTLFAYAFGKPVEVVDVGNGDSPTRTITDHASKPLVVNFPPLREHQRALYDHRQRFNVWVCHRRFGKTVLALYQLIADAYANTRPRPRYGYLAPLYRQGKVIAWDLLKHLTRPPARHQDQRGRAAGRSHWRPPYPNIRRR